MFPSVIYMYCTYAGIHTHMHIIKTRNTTLKCGYIIYTLIKILLIIIARSLWWLFLVSRWLYLELNTTQESEYTYEGFFVIKLYEVGRPAFKLDLLEWKDTTYSGPRLLLPMDIKGMEERIILLFVCFPSLWLARPLFHQRWTHFFWIMMYDEDHWRHPAS